MEYSDRGFEGVIAYIYEYFSEFKLLITRAPGNYYQDFFRRISRTGYGLHEKNSWFKLEVKLWQRDALQMDFLHVVSSAFLLRHLWGSNPWHADGRSKEVYLWIAFIFMGMAGKNTIENRKEGVKKMQKTKEFLCGRKRMDTLPLFVNAERGQRYEQILH